MFNKYSEKNSWKKPFIKFWTVEKKHQIKIEPDSFKRFLEGEGFFKIKKEKGYLFVRKLNKIVEEFDSTEVKDFVQDYIKLMPVEELGEVGKSNVIDSLIKASGQLFTKNFFEFLDTKEIEFQRDEVDTSYLYFSNKVIGVKSDKIEQVDYAELKGHVWKNQIIDRDYYAIEKRSDFEEFLYNISNKEAQRYKALKSAIGYLLHTFKDPNKVKAIIFIDEKLSEGAFGRSGKGLVIKAISQLRKIVIEDGRNFNIGKNFAFQRVNSDTNIIAIEDIRDQFQFDKLFSILAEGITIEKKHRDEIFIRFAESPKIVISTNFSIKGIDDSTLDRQFLIEFSDYYNKNHRPYDDFGKLFFDQWDNMEFSAFDGFMIECLQEYLTSGLSTYEYINLEMKRLIDETCADFAEFSEGLILDTQYDKKDLFNKYADEYTDTHNLEQAKFTKWIKLWARIKYLEVEESKSGNIRYIKFKNLKKVA